MARNKNKVIRVNGEGWMKGLPSGLIENVKTLEPDLVEFEIIQPKTIMCRIKKGDREALGIAICSVRDEASFSVKAGKKLAAGRAVRAFQRNEPTLRIRGSEDQFPRTWSRSQMKRVTEVADAAGYKSRLAQGHDQDVAVYPV